MALTSSSRFDRVKIGRNPTTPGLSLTIWVDDGSRYGWGLNIDGISGGSRSDLEIVQGIWASSEGLRDSDGSAITVDIRRFISGVTDENDLEDHGFPNPLQEGSYERWLNVVHNVEGHFLKTGEVEVDADTGRSLLALAGDIGTSYRVPAGANYAAALDQLRVIAVNDNSFQMQLEVTPEQGDGITINNIASQASQDKIRNFPGMRAWEAFLRDAATTAIPDDDEWGYDYDAGFSNRNYEWEQESGSTVRFQIQGGLTVMSTSYNGAGNLRGLTVQFTQANTSPADYNEDLMQAYLDINTVSTPVNGVALEPTTIGTRESRGRFERVNIGDGHLYRRRDGAIIDSYPVGLNGEMEHIPLSGDFGISVDMVDISVATGDTYKRVPVGPYVNAVHLADSGVAADQNLQLPLPTQGIGFKDRDRGYLIHNKNDTYRINLRDWDGNVFFHVEPRERAYWRMTQGAWGYGEWTSVSLPTRHLVYTMSRDDLDELDDLVRLDTSEEVDGSTVNGKAYVLPQPSAASGYDFLHDDFFTTWASGDFTTDLAILDETAAANVRKVGAIEIAQDITGFLETDINLSMKTKSGLSGTIEIPELRIYRFRSDAVSAYVEQVVSNMWQADKFYSHPLVHRGRVQKGDILIPVFWVEDGQSISDLDDVQLRQITFELTVEPQIALEYSP